MTDRITDDLKGMARKYADEHRTEGLVDLRDQSREALERMAMLADFAADVLNGGVAFEIVENEEYGERMVSGIFLNRLDAAVSADVVLGKVEEVPLSGSIRAHANCPAGCRAYRVNVGHGDSMRTEEIRRDRELYPPALARVEENFSCCASFETYAVGPEHATSLAKGWKGEHVRYGTWIEPPKPREPEPRQTISFSVPVGEVVEDGTPGVVETVTKLFREGYQAAEAAAAVDGPVEPIEPTPVKTKQPTAEQLIVMQERLAALLPDSAKRNPPGSENRRPKVN
jgi:hypothetical protein